MNKIVGHSLCEVAAGASHRAHPEFYI